VGGRAGQWGRRPDHGRTGTGGGCEGGATAYRVSDVCSTNNDGDTYEEVVPFPDEEEEDNKELEETAPISNAAVLESTVVTSPIGEAWKVYPELYMV